MRITISVQAFIFFPFRRKEAVQKMRHELLAFPCIRKHKSASKFGLITSLPCGSR